MPPKVRLPLLVTVPVRVKPLTVPVPPTLVTVPAPMAERAAAASAAVNTASPTAVAPRFVLAVLALPRSDKLRDRNK